MSTQLYTVKMNETMRNEDCSYNIDKNGQSHLEMVDTHTPLSEHEKQQLAPVASRGPEVHEKVHVNHFTL
jgi:hypothetical protein